MARMRNFQENDPDVGQPSGQNSRGPLWPGFGSQEDFPLGGGDNLQGIDLGSGIIGKGGTTSREEGLNRQTMGSGGAGGGGNVAPRRPSEPTPMAGSTAPPPPEIDPGPIPFEPMNMAPTSKLAMPRGGGGGNSVLYGSAGGLQGGGLGQAFDPTSDLQSDPISTLMMLLQSAGKVR